MVATVLAHHYLYPTLSDGCDLLGQEMLLNFVAWSVG